MLPVRLAKLSILRKGMILLGVPLAFQLGMLAYLVQMHARVAEAERLEVHTKEVMAQANAIRTLLFQGHGALRVLVLYNDPEFERAERQRLQTLPAEIRTLEQLVQDSPAQGARLCELRDELAQYLEWAAEMEALAQANRWKEYVELFRTKQGKARVDALENQLIAFIQVEEQVDTQRRDSAQQWRQKQERALLAAGMVTVLLATGLMVAFARNIGRRLQVVTDNARRMAEGHPLAEPVRGGDEIAMLDAAVHDTARRLAAAAARERQDAEELQRRAQQLQKTNEELVYKTQENETFVYSVSHDLRSPLVNLQGFTKELAHGCRALRETLAELELAPAVRQRIDLVIDEDIATSANFIQAAVTRSSNIINALLKLSRAGRVEYQKQPVDLLPIVERIVASMRVSLQERRAQVAIGELPPVLADPTAVEQVLANLIGNAVNYLDQSRPGRIEVGSAPAANDDGQATVFVKDNGTGIPAAYLPKLFVAFQRLHGDLAPGEGIGLALVKRIVDRHGGRIWAESTPGESTVFYVSLPRATVTEAATETAGVRESHDC